MKHKKHGSHWIGLWGNYIWGISMGGEQRVVKSGSEAASPINVPLFCLSSLPLSVLPSPVHGSFLLLLLHLLSLHHNSSTATFLTYPPPSSYRPFLWSLPPPPCNLHLPWSSLLFSSLAFPFFPVSFPLDAEGLADSAIQFRHSSRRLQRKAWWQQFRMKLVLAAILAIIIIIVISK